MLVIKNKSIIVATIFVCVLISCALTLAGEVYVAPPIVFVHGLNSGDYTWVQTKNALQKYFINEQTGELKYEYTNFSSKPYCYFPICTYEWMNTGDIPTIASDLLFVYISDALRNIPENCPNKKVNVVAHSMGGLVTRSLLRQKDYYKNYINRTVFIGTPHTGSPYASALWLLNKVKTEKLPPLLKENDFYAKTAFATKDFSQSERLAYAKLVKNLKARYDHIAFVLNRTKKWGLDSESLAINELRLNQDVSYYDIIFGIAGDKVKTAEIMASHSGAETFLADNNALSVPTDYKTIAGKNTSNNLFWGLSKILSHGNAFTFSAGESLADVSVNGGDGIVSLGSQSELGRISTTINGINHLTEPQQAQAILNALDDSPVIENLRVLSANKYANGPGYFVYVITRVKDYLLADIEISSMTVDGSPVNLSEFDDGAGHPKPYVKFKKNFLKERPDSSVLDKYGNVVTLKPGEFYVRLYLEGDDPHVINIDLKNPSTNPHATASLTIQRPIISNESPTGTITNTRPTIEAQIQSPRGIDIYSNSLVMKVNGSVVSHTTSGSGANINIYYTPNDDLDDGRYTVTVDGKDVNGIPAEQKEWTFTVQTQRPIITNETPKGDVMDTTPNISARIYSPVGTPINLSSLDMKLDGYTVSHSTSGSGSDITVSYISPSDLTSTTHTVHLYGQDINGLSASKTWTFTIKYGYFIVEIPAKISIDQDFTMKVTACNGLGQAMDGQDGRELYDEDADITISGSPAPQGSLTVTHINSGGWVNGVWQISNQRCTNSTENKYKLTVTVTDAGGTHAGMTGQAETIVSPLELNIRVVGGWFVDRETGNWQDFSENATVYNDILFCQDYYSPQDKYYGGIECLYKTEIPIGSHINSIDIALRIYPYDGHDFPGSSVYKEILYARYGAIPPIPSDINVEINIDYSFNFPLSPVGEHSLIHEIIGDGKWSGSVYYRPWGSSKVATYIPPGTIIKTIPIADENIQTVWISVYTVNMQSAAEQFEAGLYAYNHEGEGQIGERTQYHIVGMYGYNE